MPTVHAKTFLQRSGAKVLIAGFIGVLIGYLPQIVDVFQFPQPWDGIVPILVGFIVAILKLVQQQLSNPSVDAYAVPARVVNTKGVQVSGPK